MFLEAWVVFVPMNGYGQPDQPSLRGEPIDMLRNTFKTLAVLAVVGGALCCQRGPGIPAVHGWGGSWGSSGGGWGSSGGSCGSSGGW